jgi:hypothetical protein
VSYGATITQPSVPTKPTFSTRNTNADTKAPRHINNGKTLSNGTSKPSSPTFPQLFMGRISYAQTYGPMPSTTGLGCTTPPPMQSSRTHPPASLIPISTSMHTTNTDLHSGTYSASPYKTTNACGSSTLKTTSVFMWAMRTASKEVPSSICPTPTTSSQGATDIVY